MDRLSVLAKGDFDQWEALIKYAETTLEPILAKVVIEVLQGLRGRISEHQISQLLAHGGDALALAIMGLLNEDTMYRLVATGVQKALGTGARHFGDSSKVITVKFNALHPSVARAVKEQTFGLIQQITEGTRDGIKGYVSENLKLGINPRDTAREIKGIIGLTDRQARAVANYRRFLETGKVDALQRELRDHRADPRVRAAIDSQVPLPKPYIDTLVAKYEKRYIAYRAQVIARSESITALNTSQDLIWAQAIENGDVEEGEMYSRWFLAHDERICPICKEIPDMNPDGVALGQPFDTPIGPIVSPPAHPQCRCAKFTRPRIRRAA